MFNRIGQAVLRTSRRYFPKGRHRRRLTPVRATVVHLGLSHRPTLLVGQLRDREDLLAGEETAVVRPYALVGEEEARQLSTITSHEPFAHTCLVPMGAH